MNATRRKGVALAVSILLTAAGGAASAQDAAPDPNEGQRSDGLVTPPREGHPYLLAVPRFLLLPFRGLVLLAQYPLKSSADFTEYHHTIQWMNDATTEADGKRGVRLNFDFQAHFAGSAGLTYFDRKTLGPDSSLEVRGSFGGKEIAQGGVYLRPLPAANRTQIDGRFDFVHRNDQYYDGAGPPNVLHSRYKIDAVSAVAGIHRQLVRPVILDVTGESAWKRFGPGDHMDGDLPIDDVFCYRILGHCQYGTVNERLVPGFANGTQFLRGAVGFRVDTNDRPLEPQAGFIGALKVDYTHGIFDGDNSSYFRIHSMIGLVIDLWHRSHVLVLRVAATLVEPIGNSIVPFSELPQLGDPDALRGFILGSVRDQSVLVYRVEYRWPIWMYSDALIFADYGGAYQRNFADFSNRRTYWDLGFGIRVFTQSRFFVHLGLAYGFDGGGWQFFVRGDSQ